MAIELTTTADGVILPVQAQPRAKRSEIVGEHNGRVKVAVTEVPEKGKANEISPNRSVTGKSPC